MNEDQIISSNSVSDTEYDRDHGKDHGNAIATDQQDLSRARRSFMQHGVAGLATLGAAAGTPVPGLAADTLSKPGAVFSNYGQSVDERRDIIRWISANPAVPGNGVSWTPLHALDGTITPNGLHFERHHNGVPHVDGEGYRCVIDGLVHRPLQLDLATLLRYPRESRVVFIECGGNSNSLWHPDPVQAPAGYLHGLVSSAEWTGVRLADLLRQAGVRDGARWVIAEGLDSAGVSVSLPLGKMMDDVLLALFQNGEPLRREQGYPARLIVPGWEGITHVKWLRRLYLADRPAMSRFDTVSYTDLLADGTAERFTFRLGVKSVITAPSAGQQLGAPGSSMQISGLAWSGGGPIEQVDVSTDGGHSWQSAELQEPVLDKALVRFRHTWRWSGKPAVLQSRARDAEGRVQPTRGELLSAKGGNAYYHFNGIVSWAVATNGAVSHVYA